MPSTAITALTKPNQIPHDNGQLKSNSACLNPKKTSLIGYSRRIHLYLWYYSWKRETKTNRWPSRMHINSFGPKVNILFLAV